VDYIILWYTSGYVSGQHSVEGLNCQPEVYGIRWPFKNPLYVSEGLYEELPIGIVLRNEQFQLSFCNSIGGSSEQFNTS